MVILSGIMALVFPTACWSGGLANDNRFDEYYTAGDENESDLQSESDELLVGIGARRKSRFFVESWWK
jgi:hypothetical protein